LFHVTHACLFGCFILQVWTAHESAARELMSLELEDMRAAVDKMSDEELAQVAMRMMAVSGLRRMIGAANEYSTPDSSTIAALDKMSDEELAQVAMRMMAVSG
jgi:hypothetical protein